MGAQAQGAQFTDGRWLTISRTLSFVLNGDDVLLMKRGAHRRVFPNRYNGVGGHIERDEDVFTSARREILEETGLTVTDLRLRAVSNIDSGGETGILLFVFTAWSDAREVIESDEGTLHWVARDAVAGLDVVDDLRDLLPRALAMSDDQAPYFLHVSYDESDGMVLRFAE